MTSITTELKVGLFVLGTSALLVSAWAWTFDGVRPGESSYDVKTVVPSADGLWPGTPVKLAGVEVGAVQAIDVVGGNARLTLRIRKEYALPEDTLVELRSTGMLGDRFVTVLPGRSETPVADGATLAPGEPPMDLDAVGREVRTVAADVGGSAARIRAMLEDGQTEADLRSSLAQLATLTAGLADAVKQNRSDVDGTIASLRRVSNSLDQLVARSSPKVDAGLDDLQEAAQKLDSVLDDLQSITAKLDRGDGSAAVLINDRGLVDRLDGTLQNASDKLDGMGAMLDAPSKMRLDAWTSGRARFEPGEGVGTGGTVGLELGPSPDLWLSAELVAEPRVHGTVLANKRWGPASVRAGLREGGEGVGLSAYGLGDRLAVSADAFDFTGRLADRPTGVPDLRLGLSARPLPRLSIEVASDELLLSPGSGGIQPWVGVGVHATAPRPPER